MAGTTKPALVAAIKAYLEKLFRSQCHHGRVFWADCLRVASRRQIVTVDSIRADDGAHVGIIFAVLARLAAHRVISFCRTRIYLELTARTLKSLVGLTTGSGVNVTTEASFSSPTAQKKFASGALMKPKEFPERSFTSIVPEALSYREVR